MSERNSVEAASGIRLADVIAGTVGESGVVLTFVTGQQLQIRSWAAYRFVEGTYSQMQLEDWVKAMNASAPTSDSALAPDPTSTRLVPMMRWQT